MKNKNLLVIFSIISICLGLNFSNIANTKDLLDNKNQIVLEQTNNFSSNKNNEILYNNYLETTSNENKNNRNSDENFLIIMILAIVFIILIFIVLLSAILNRRKSIKFEDIVEDLPISENFDKDDLILQESLIDAYDLHDHNLSEYEKQEYQYDYENQRNKFEDDFKYVVEKQSDFLSHLESHLDIEENSIFDKINVLDEKEYEHIKNYEHQEYDDYDEYY